MVVRQKEQILCNRLETDHLLFTPSLFSLILGGESEAHGLDNGTVKTDLEVTTLWVRGSIDLIQFHIITIVKYYFLGLNYAETTSLQLRSKTVVRYLQFKLAKFLRLTQIKTSTARCCSRYLQEIVQYSFLCEL